MPKSQTDASKRARRSKRKGKAFEKSVAQDIAQAFSLKNGFTTDLKYGITADCDVTTTRSGQDDCDIGLSERAKEVYPCWTECKDQKTLAIPAWLAQVAEAQKRHNDKRVPVIVFKQHGSSKKHAVVPFDVLLDLFADRAKLEELYASGDLR